MESVQVCRGRSGGRCRAHPGVPGQIPQVIATYNILDGSSDIGTSYLIVLSHSITSSVVTNRFFFFSEKTYYPSRVRNMVTIYNIIP